MKVEKIEREQFAAIQPSSGDNNYPTPEIAHSGSVWNSYVNGFAAGFTNHLDAVGLMDRVSMTADETVINAMEIIDANLAYNLLEARTRCEQSHSALVAQRKS